MPDPPHGSADRQTPYVAGLPSGTVIETFDRRQVAEDSQAAAAREGLLLVLLTADLGLLLALIPALDASLSPFWQTFLSLGGGLALGKRWVTDQVLAIGGRRGALRVSGLLLGVLLFVHAARQLPLVPLQSVPADAIVRLDDAKEPLVGRRMTLGAHKITVEPQFGWDSSARVIQVSALESFGNLFSGQPVVAAVGCLVTINLDAEDAGAEVTVAAERPFEASLPAKAPVAGAVQLRRSRPEAVVIEFRNTTAGQIVLPVGDYALVATRMDSSGVACRRERSVKLLGSDCSGSSPGRFEELCAQD